jgi:hypothetical protein
MSRGPGAIERRVVSHLEEWGIRTSLEIAGAVFVVECRDPKLWLERSRLTLAQIGVRRVLRRLASRGMIEPATLIGQNGATMWRLKKRTVRQHGPNPLTLRRRRKPISPMPPPAPAPVGAPVILGDAAVKLPFAASTRVLGLRRVPVQRRRRGPPGLY